nr:SdrD B-like domain-containing protein [Rosistilla oblonga]
MSDWAWLDANGDGIQSSGEQGVEDVLVTLYQWNGSSWTYLDHEETDAGGNYSFDDLYEGEYGVAFSAPVGYGFTIQHAHYDHDIDSDAPWYTLYLEEGEDRDDVDAGLVFASCSSSSAGYMLASTCSDDLIVDLDTDSNNTRTIGDTVDGIDEDDVESTEAKRIFVNRDDDNENGIHDLIDPTPLAFPDKDLAKAIVSIENLDSTQHVELVLPAGLRAWGSSSKADVAGVDGTEITATGDTGKLDPWMFEVWEGTLRWEPGIAPPSELFIEGVVAGTSNQSVNLRVVNQDGSIAGSDVALFRTEELVWPFVSAGNQFPDGNSIEWKGLKVGTGWTTEKTLIDYILNPADKGEIETHHNDKPAFGGEPTNRATGEFEDSVSLDNLGAGTLTFTYSFDRRGEHQGNPFGYVQPDLTARNADETEVDGPNRDRTRLSFIGNSGIKFAGAEINIIDVDALIDLANDEFAYESSRGGTGFKGISETGRVDVRRHILGAGRDFEDEQITQMKSGVKYDTQPYNLQSYQKMDDFNPLGAVNWVDFRAMLHANANRQGMTNTMSITTGAAGFTVRINGQQTYRDAGFTSNLGAFKLQSHWGSGVVFSGMNFA